MGCVLNLEGEEIDQPVSFSHSPFILFRMYNFIRNIFKVEFYLEKQPEGANADLLMLIRRLASEMRTVIIHYVEAGSEL